MKKVQSYNLSVEVLDQINIESEKEDRTASNWLDRYLTANLINNKPKIAKAPRNIFKAPSLFEVHSYCHERNNNVNPQEFIDHYEANGWMRGKAKIKDWKACVRTWEKNNKAVTNGVQAKKRIETASDKYARQSKELQERERQARNNQQNPTLI